MKRYVKEAQPYYCHMSDGFIAVIMARSDEAAHDKLVADLHSRRAPSVGIFIRLATPEDIDNFKAMGGGIW